MQSIVNIVRCGLIVFSFVLPGCEDQGSDVFLEKIDLEIVDLSIGANMMPVIPPGYDPVACQIDVVLRNPTSESYSGLSMPFAELTVSGTGEMLGTIPLHTNWKGEISPGAEAQFTLVKADSLSHLTRIPCGEDVELKLVLYQLSRAVKTSVTGAVRFGCVY